MLEDDDLDKKRDEGLALLRVLRPPRRRVDVVDGDGVKLLRPEDIVYFTTDSTDLSPEATTTLQKQAQWLQRYPQYTITIEGHADERGTREYNIALGAKRATTVRNFLAQNGVNGARIRTISYGKERPVAVCNDISCWSQNRRAVTVLNASS